MRLRLESLPPVPGAGRSRRGPRRARRSRVRESGRAPRAAVCRTLRSKGVVERPGVAGRELLELRIEVRLGNLGQEAHGHEALGEGVMDERLCLDVGQHSLFQEFDLARETAEMLLEAQDRAGEFHAQFKTGGVLALDRDHVATECEVVADEDREAGAELDRHGFVVGGAMAERGAAVRGLTVCELEDAEEDRAVAAEGELFPFDADLVLDKDAVEHVHQLDVGNGFEGWGHFGRGQHLKFGAGDNMVSTWDMSWACCRGVSFLGSRFVR